MSNNKHVAFDTAKGRIIDHWRKYEGMAMFGFEIEDFTNVDALRECKLVVAPYDPSYRDKSGRVPIVAYFDSVRTLFMGANRIANPRNRVIGYLPLQLSSYICGGRAGGVNRWEISHITLDGRATLTLQGERWGHWADLDRYAVTINA